MEEVEEEAARLPILTVAGLGAFAAMVRSIADGNAIDLGCDDHPSLMVQALLNKISALGGADHG